MGARDRCATDGFQSGGFLPPAFFRLPPQVGRSRGSCFGCRAILKGEYIAPTEKWQADRHLSKRLSPFRSAVKMPSRGQAPHRQSAAGLPTGLEEREDAFFTSSPRLRRGTLRVLSDSEDDRCAQGLRLGRLARSSAPTSAQRDRRRGCGDVKNASARCSSGCGQASPTSVESAPVHKDGISTASLAHQARAPPPVELVLTRHLCSSSARQKRKLPVTASRNPQSRTFGP